MGIAYSLRYLRITLILLLVTPCKVQGQSLLKETKVDSISIIFKFGGSTIDNRSQIVKRINNLDIGENGRIILKAYTDTTGSIKFNNKLATKRLKESIILIKSTKLKSLHCDSLNMNERRGKASKNDTLYRRVDIIIYKIELNFKFDTPIDLKINFESNSDRLSQTSSESLENLKTILEMDTSLTIQLNGHVCCEPDAELSLKRAQRVKLYLTRKGIKESRIICEGFSNNVKLVPETSEKNRAINRRVEVVFIKK